MITFDSVDGAKRADMKLRYDLITTELQERLARTMTLGSIKYGDNNWKKGGPNFAIDCFNHTIEHLNKFKDDDVSEDHLGHALANIMFLCFYQTPEAKFACIENEIKTFDQALRQAENKNTSEELELPIITTITEQSLTAQVGTKLADLFGWVKK